MVAPTTGVVVPRSKSLASSRVPVRAVTPPAGGSGTVMIMVSEAADTVSLPEKVSTKVELPWLGSGAKLKRPDTALKLAFVGNGRGVTKKVSGPVPPLPVTVKLRVLPTLMVWLPIGLSATPEDTLKVEEAIAEFVARSETAKGSNLWLTVGMRTDTDIFDVTAKMYRISEQSG